MVTDTIQLLVEALFICAEEEWAQRRVWVPVYVHDLDKQSWVRRATAAGWFS